MKFCILLLSMLLLGCCGLVDMRTICSSYPDAGLRDSCFSSLAIKDADSSMCKEIQNSSERDYCFMRLAILKLNNSECAPVGMDLQAQCGRVVEGVKQNNSIVCKEIKDNITAELCWGMMGRG